MVRVCRLLFCAVALAAGTAGAQTGSVTGAITDAASGQPVDGALVAALTATGTAAATAVSGNDGRYRLNGVPVGSYTVRITRIGYRPVERAGVTVAANTPTTLDVQLTETALRLEGVVVSGSRIAQKETDAPASTAVVEQTQVNERPSTTVVDHIRGIAGVDVVQGGVLQSNVTVRGFNNIFSGSLLTLADNRFAFVPSLRVNVPYLMPTNNEDIERIEVVLGPGAALYGPNAANGVLHVITRSPFDSRGTTLTLDAGNQSVLRTAIRHAGAPTERFGYKLSFEVFRGEDFPSVDTNEPEDPPGSGRRLRDFDLEKFGGEARVDFRPTPGTEIIGTYGFARAGNAIEPTGLGAAQVKDWTFNTFQLQGVRGRLFAQVFLNTSDAGETFLLRNRPSAASTAGRVVDKSMQWVFQAQHGIALGTRQDFIYGFDYQATEPKTDGTINGRYENDDDFTEIGGYLHSTTRLMDKLDLVTALRLDKHSRVDDAVWSPRAAFVFKPVDGQAIRLTYNRAFTSPSSNNQFLDLRAGQLPATGPALYEVRTLGTPPEGLTFRRDCTGGIGSLCMRSPFAPTSGFIPASASGFYPAALAAASAGNALRNALVAQGGLTTAQADGVVQKLQTSAPPSPATVGSVLRVLNPTTRAFTNVGPEFVQDIAAIEPTINETFEIGYKGFVADRLTLNVDVWRQQRENFVTPLLVQSPNVFIDAASIGPYIANTLATGPGALPPAQAAALAPLVAAILGGVPGSTAATGVPVGVVNPTHAFANHSDIILAYRNFGDVDLWGTDFGAEVLLTDRISAIGSWSYASKDVIPQANGPEVTLNAPTEKGMAGVRYRDMGLGLSGELRARFTHGFPANSGVYVGYVTGYTLWDANVSYRPALFPNAMVSLNAMNLTDNEHVEFVGGATLGRLIMTRLQYTF